MLRFLNRLIPKKTLWKLQIPHAHRQLRFCSNVNSMSPSKSEELTKYSKAVNFYNLLTQYQIDKMKGTGIDTNTLSSVESQLKNYAEDIFTASALDPKIVSNMLQKLKNENLLTEQMIKNLVNQMSELSYDVLHQLTLDSLLTILREIEKYQLQLNDKEKEKVQSLILYHLSVNRWEFVKDFLDLFAGKMVAREIFNKDIELKLVWLLNYANLQVVNFQFFCSLAFSIYSTLSNNNDRFNLIPHVEEVVEEKFNAKGVTYDINDIENLLFFFPENMTFHHNTANKLAHNILTFNSKINFDSFKKFLKLSMVNNYIFSQHPKDQQEKLFEYILDCSTLEDFRLFSVCLDQIRLYPERLANEENVLQMIRKFLPELLKENEFKEIDLLFVRYLLERTTSQEEKKVLFEIISNATKEVTTEVPFSYLSLLYSTAITYRKQHSFETESLQNLLLDILTKPDSETDTTDIVTGVKYFLEANLALRSMKAKEREILARIEILVKSPTFQSSLEFYDLKDFLRFLHGIWVNKVSTSEKFLRELCQKFYPELEPNVILEEVVHLFPIIADLPFVQAELFPKLFANVQTLLKDRELDLEFVFKVCKSLDYLTETILNNREVKTEIKNLWIAFEPFIFKILVISQPKNAKKPNIFLDEETNDKDDGKEKYILNEFVSDRNLTILHEIFLNLIKWNIGTRKLYDIFQVLFDKYFDKFKENDMPRIAYYLGEINSSEGEFTEKLENHLLVEKRCGTPFDALQYAWFFILKNNHNQDLWNVIMNDLGQLESLDNIPVKYLLNLYEMLFCLRLDRNYVNIGNLTKFIDKLDDIWQQNNNLHQSKFKKAINEFFEEECYKLEPDARASLYKVDYIYNEKDVVIILGEETYLGDSKRHFGSVELRQRVLNKLGFKLHLIEQREFLAQKKTLKRVEYVKKKMLGVPRDYFKWKARRNMVPPSYDE